MAIDTFVENFSDAVLKALALFTSKCSPRADHGLRYRLKFMMKYV
jgi:hypothetical protein